MTTIKNAIQEWVFPTTVLIGWATASIYTLALCKFV